MLPHLVSLIPVSLYRLWDPYRKLCSSWHSHLDRKTLYRKTMESWQQRGKHPCIESVEWTSTLKKSYNLFAESVFSYLSLILSIWKVPSFTNLHRQQDIYNNTLLPHVTLKCGYISILISSCGAIYILSKYHKQNMILWFRMSHHFHQIRSAHPLLGMYSYKGLFHTFFDSLSQ